MIDSVEISFKPWALFPRDEQPGEFSFMGLIENFEICIDGATRIPVQVSGQISRIEKPLFLSDQQRKTYSANMQHSQTLCFNCCRILTWPRF